MRANLFGLGIESEHSQITSAALVNVYLERRPAGEKTQVVALSTPGLRQFCDAAYPVRGWIFYERGNVVYLVAGATLYEMSAAGALTSRGTLNTSSGYVGIAHNGDMLGIVDGGTFYTYDIGTLTLDGTVTDSPANPETVAYQDGYFIVSVADSNAFFIGEGSTWNTLDFASAESAPDDIVAIYADQSEVVIFGGSTTEFWQDSGAVDFPYARIPGSSNEWGLAAKQSIAKFDNSIMYLARNRSGQVMVAQLNGYLPKRVSTHDIDRIINGYTATSDAVAYSFMLSGHSMYVISFPSGDATWLYDGTIEKWSRLESHDLNRHRSLRGLNAFEKVLVSDYSTGAIYELRSDELTDNGETIARELTSDHIASPDGERFAVSCLRLAMVVGEGLASGQGSDPQMMLRVSRDGGRTWGSEIWASMGAQGEYRRQVEFRRLGQARTFTFRLRVTDPVPVAIMSASINPRD